MRKGTDLSPTAYAQNLTAKWVREEC